MLRGLLIPSIAIHLLVNLLPNDAAGQCYRFEQDKLTASDAAPGDFFGYSVAVSGDTLVVGSGLDDHIAGVNAGSAYVFIRSGSDWVQQAKLIASNGGANHYFGFSVAISGDTLVIGAPTDLSLGTANGSAYVFVRTGTVWTQQAWIIAADGSPGDQFGLTVAISGDTLVVGAPNDDHTSGTDAGSAYVFVRSGTTWSQQAWIKAGDAGAGERFGYSVALDGESAIVGSPDDSHTGVFHAGAAYVFVRAGTLWSQQAWIKAAELGVSDFFGGSVGISGGTVVVGAPYDDHAAGTNAGSTFVFTRSGTTWTQEASLKSTKGGTDDLFGYSVSVFGNMLVAGSGLDDHGGGVNAGSACLFFRSGGVWIPQGKLVASDAGTGDRFGSGVAISADSVVVGSPAGNLVGTPDQGIVYWYDPLASAVVAGDIDSDGDVDYGDLTGFANVLVGLDNNFEQFMRADLDCSDSTDGRDIRHFVDLFLN